MFFFVASLRALEQILQMFPGLIYCAALRLQRAWKSYGARAWCQ